jgi:hypothetical protein
MARPRSRKSAVRSSKASAKGVGKSGRRFCSMQPLPPIALAANVSPERAALIQILRPKWVNGTVLQFSFFDGGTAKERDVIRAAFQAWKGVGVGLDFREVQGRADHIRIGFERGAGAWSYVGRDLLDHEHNMNFGWNIEADADTALHEIGHALGFPHEHQNPNAGIVWDEEAVYAALAAPPNSWDRDKTFYNIIRKLPAQEVRGSEWDPNSIMHYPFEAGLIKAPAQYHAGLHPAGGLSALDKTFAKTFYPPMKADDVKELQPFLSQQVSIAPGQQVNFRIKPAKSRNYTMQTIGEADTLLVLFEDQATGDPVYLSGDDDSGQDFNAKIAAKLIQGRTYTLRIRLYYVQVPGECGVLLT